MIFEIMLIVSVITIIVLTFIKFMREKKTNYIYMILNEIIGILSSLILISISKSYKLFANIIVIILSIFIPIIVYILDKKDINIKEIYYLAKAKANYKETKDILIETIKKYPFSYRLHKKLAEYYEKNNEIEKAENEYLLVIKFKKLDYDSYLKLGNLLHIDKKDEEAKKILESVLKYNPQYYEASLLLGNILYENNQFKQAANIYNNALKYFPNKYELYYHLGMTYTKLNDFNYAKECYQKAATINSIKDIANLNIGQINMIFKEYDEAEKYFYEGIKSDDDKIVSESYYYLAKIKLIKNQNEQAIQYCNIALELNPKIIKKMENDNYFILILGKLNIDKIKENKIKTKLSDKEEKLIEHLENTYNVVEEISDDYKIQRQSQNNKKEKEL